MALSYASHPYKQRVWILSLDERDWREVHGLLFKESDLRSLAGLGEADFFSVEYKIAKNFSLQKLARRSYSSHEMRKLLENHLVSAETIDGVIAACVESGYIDDADWISGFIGRCRGKNLSRRAIQQKLQAKGVPVEDLMIESSEKEAIRHLLETKYRKYDLSDPAQKRKVFGALARRGFSSEEIFRAIVSV